MCISSISKLLWKLAKLSMLLLFLICVVIFLSSFLCRHFSVVISLSSSFCRLSLLLISVVFLSVMSRISDKVKTQRELYLLFLHHWELNKKIETLQYLILPKELEKQRYYSRLFVSKSNWASSVLFQLCVSRFREYERMNRDSLTYVVNLIRNDQAFRNKFINLQTLIENQI